MEGPDFARIAELIDELERITKRAKQLREELASHRQQGRYWSDVRRDTDRLDGNFIPSKSNTRPDSGNAGNDGSDPTLN